MKIFALENDQKVEKDNNENGIQIHIQNEKNYHHIAHVMRKKEGDKITVVFEQDPNTYFAQITKVDKNANCIELDVIKVEEKQRESNIQIDIYQAIAKKDRLEYFFEKATELGATSFNLVNFKRNVVKTDAQSIQKKIQRWDNIVLSACKQSKRDMIPKITYIDNLNQITFDQDLIILLDANQKSMTIEKIVENVQSKNIQVNKIGIIIGPEGGFEKEEISILEQKNAQSAVIGKRVFRTETAAIVAISILQYIYGDF